MFEDNVFLFHAPFDEVDAALSALKLITFQLHLLVKERPLRALATFFVLLNHFIKKIIQLKL